MTNKKPLVSIVITAYNYAEYIEKSIDSALGQSYKNIELIVINDGSTDNTNEVIEKYSTQATIVNQENLGVIATRNKGMRLATGEYVMQLDADDYLDAQYVENCVRVAEKGNDIVYTQVRHFGRVDFDSRYIQYDLEKLKHSNYIHATSLIRKSILSENPYDEYLNNKGYEDWDLFLGLCLNGAMAALVDKPLLYYRKHESEISRSDLLGGTKKEILARHHIWSKYNASHRDDFWYFSSEIDLLLRMIELYEIQDKIMSNLEYRKRALDEKEHHIRRLEQRDPITVGRKVVKKAIVSIKGMNAKKNR